MYATQLTWYLLTTQQTKTYYPGNKNMLKVNRKITRKGANLIQS